MRILVHVCCGPCALYPMERVARAGHKLTGLFYNPNIHPFQEFRRRLEGVLALEKARGWPMLVDENYGLRDYLRQVVFDENRRCHLCYDMRLRHVARQARDGGYDAFTTTLLYSRYQKHGLIRERAEWWAARHGVDFYYEDFRPGWQEGIDGSIRLGLYRQPYCGCIYSEQERYDKAMRPRRSRPVQEASAG